MPTAMCPRFRSLIWMLCVALCAALPARGAADRSTAAKPVVAYWTFDQASNQRYLDHGSNGCHATWPPNQQTVQTTNGLFGQAVQLSGKHALQVPDNPCFESLDAITLSVWVKPTDLSGYREIFRKEDGDRRVLFSFQQGGTILSLGLNVGGYVECDAPIDPAQVLDGTWHHGAATFDGQMMRVYLDGKQVGELRRPGRISSGGPAAGFIGSSHGTECFQGAMDELHIDAACLSPDEIGRRYQQGVAAVAAYTRRCEKQLQAIYSRADDLAGTLAACRQRLWENGFQQDATELASMVSLRLKADFPDQYRRFIDGLRATVPEYLLAAGNEFHLRRVGRLVELMVEYKPLTDHQWQGLSAEARARWHEAEVIQRQFQQLKAQGDAVKFSPQWIRIALKAGERTELRPYLSEAVAPYVKPRTPVTRNLTQKQARQVLRRDWLFQADDKPTRERILAEIQWTRQLASRLQTGGAEKTQFRDELASLERLEQQARSLSSPDTQVYFRVREVKHQVAFKNPVIDFTRVLFVDMPLPQGSEWPHQTRHRLGYMAVPGGRLLVLDGLSPAGNLTQLMPQAPLHGSFWRPDLSYDGRTVLFCFKPHNEKSFHLYQINVDGTHLVQLTDGPFDDLDPIYLPDQRHIVFSTTRGQTYVRCMPPTNAFVLARCDRSGKNIYLISRNSEPDYLPSVMSDGRIIYTRWEYTDKPLWRAQGLWTVHPDGTQVNTFWGNQSVWPDLLKDARQIPGSHRVMFTGSAHHNWFSGSVGILDPRQGYNFPGGLAKVTADVAWPESGNGPLDPVYSARYHASGQYTAYYSPYPLSEQDFLVSASRDGKFVLYWMDVDGNRELIYEGAHHLLHALPVRARERPPVVPDRVAWPDRRHRQTPRDGMIYSRNVYAGAPSQLAGRARYLRVLSIDPKTYTYWYKRPLLSTGPVVSAVQSEGVKRILGTVPIEEDGSVAFRAPSGTAVHFQLLDEHYRALQTMRSFTGVMPGERRGCQGCHELHSTAPWVRGESTALSRPPRPITPPPWTDNTVSFERYVQPVLDKYCGQCHQGDGQATRTVDLTARPGPLMFSQPYLLLTGRPSWGRPYAMPDNPPPGFGIANMIMVEGYDTRDPKAYTTPEPMTRLSYRSELIDIARTGKHYGARVDPVSLRRLIVWVDAMCPYRGEEEIRAIDDPVFQGVNWLATRPRIKNAPRVIRPGPVDP